MKTKKTKTTKTTFDLSSIEAALGFKDRLSKLPRVETLLDRLVKQAHEYILEASDEGFSSDQIATALSDLIGKKVSSAMVRKALQQIKVNAGRTVVRKSKGVKLKETEVVKEESKPVISIEELRLEQRELQAIRDRVPEASVEIYRPYKPMTPEELEESCRLFAAAHKLR